MRVVKTASTPTFLLLLSVIITGGASEDALASTRLEEAIRLAAARVAAARTPEAVERWRAHFAAVRSSETVAGRVPTLSRPFVFFHQRKAGGSSMRDEIVRGAKRIRASHFVPCFDKVKCDTYEPPRTKAYAVFAGHLFWPLVERNLYVTEIHEPQVVAKPRRPKFDCLTVFRDPVDRVRSCWNYRFRGTGGGEGLNVEFSHHTAHDLHESLPVATSKYGEGCNNEPLRLFADSGEADDDVNALTTGKKPAARVDAGETTEETTPYSEEETDILSALDADYDDLGWASDAVPALRSALRHVEHCVVGVLERCDDTRRVIHAYYPWLEHDCDFVLNPGPQSKEAKQPLPADLTDETLRQNALEALMYDVANALLDVQLAAISASSDEEERPSDWMNETRVLKYASILPTLFEPLTTGNNSSRR